MGGLSSPGGEQTSISRTWMWTFRVLTGLFLSLSLALTVILLVGGEGLDFRYSVSIVSLVSLGLYALVLWGLRANPPKKLALGLGVGLEVPDPCIHGNGRSSAGFAHALHT